MISESDPILDFGNTEVAFADKSNNELKRTAQLFRLMNNPSLVKLGSSLGLMAIKMRLPFAKTAIKATIYNQFCGGTNLLDCQGVIDRIYRSGIVTILDYGAEGKTTEEEFDATLVETLKAIEFAASNDSVPCVSTKITGLADNDLLIKAQSGEPLNQAENHAYDQLLSRLTTLGDKAEELGVALFVDAEESWMQVSIDRLVKDMMMQYNRQKAIVYTTYQMYRHDKLDQFKADFDHARSTGFYLACKLVRGAYMEKERERAEDNGYPSPIHENKEAVDKDYNAALRICVDNYEVMASCNASHNLESNMLQARWIDEKGIVKNHPHLNFCQLYGMSDNITFNLASHGYNVAKYLPYGPVEEVAPYLIRRAQENTSITGDMSRELALFDTELKRRGLK